MHFDNDIQYPDIDKNRFRLGCNFILFTKTRFHELIHLFPVFMTTTIISMASSSVQWLIDLNYMSAPFDSQYIPL